MARAEVTDGNVNPPGSENSAKGSGKVCSLGSTNPTAEDKESSEKRESSEDPGPFTMASAVQPSDSSSLADETELTGGKEDKPDGSTFRNDGNEDNGTGPTALSTDDVPASANTAAVDTSISASGFFKDAAGKLWPSATTWPRPSSWERPCQIFLTEGESDWAAAAYHPKTKNQNWKMKKRNPGYDSHSNCTDLMHHGMRLKLFYTKV